VGLANHLARSSLVPQYHPVITATSCDDQPRDDTTRDSSGQRRERIGRHKGLSTLRLPGSRRLSLTKRRRAIVGGAYGARPRVELASLDHAPSRVTPRSTLYNGVPGPYRGYRSHACRSICGRGVGRAGCGGWGVTPLLLVRVFRLGRWVARVFRASTSLIRGGRRIGAAIRSSGTGFRIRFPPRKSNRNS